MGYLFAIIFAGVILYLSGAFDEESKEAFKNRHNDNNFDKSKKSISKNKKMPGSSSLDNFMDSLTKKSEEHSISGAIAGLIWYFGALLVICFAIWIFSMIFSGPLEM